MSDWDRRRFLHEVGGALWLSAAHAAPQTGAVRISVIDARSGRPTSARVRLTDSKGKELVPVGHPTEIAKDAQQGDVRFQSKRFAYVDGNFSVDPTSLPLRYQVIKGYEFVIGEGAVTSDQLREGGFTIPLSRWSSLAEK